MKKWGILTLALLLALACLASACAEDTPSTDWMMFASRTEPYYSETSAAYTFPVYAGEPVESSVQRTLNMGDRAEFAVTVPEDGQYEIWFAYFTETQSALPSEMTVSIDGAIPFYELRRVKWKSLWQDDGVFPLDRYGNEIAVTPTAQHVLQTAGMTDSAGWTDRPFLVELTAGEHTLTLDMQEGAMTLESISLRAPEEAPAYAGQPAAGDALIVIEGEKIDSRNKSSIIRPAADALRNRASEDELPGRRVL